MSLDTGIRNSAQLSLPEGSFIVLTNIAGQQSRPSSVVVPKQELVADEVTWLYKVHHLLRLFIIIN